MTIDLEHPAFFNDGAIMKLNEDFSTTEIKTTDKSSEQLSEYFAKLKEYENQQNNQKASITECCDAACPSF